MANKTWTSSASDIALMYDLPQEAIEQRMYTLAEHIHSHYCLSRGIVNHHEARPDQDVALSIIGALAATDWFLVQSEQWNHPSRPVEAFPLGLGEPVTILPGEVVIAGDTVLPVEPDDQT